MKKFVLMLSFFIILLSLASCSPINETDAQETVDTLIEYIEQGNYDSASAMVCGTDTEGMTFSEFLYGIEEATGLDFQAGIEIGKCISFESKRSGIYGTMFIACLDYQITIDGKSAVIYIDMKDNNGKLEVYFFNLDYEDEMYQYYCETE